MINENELEHLCLDWFRSMGWEVLHGPDIAHDGPQPLRQDYRDVYLRPVMAEALARINPHLPPAALEQAIDKLLKPQHLDLLDNNRQFHRWLLEGVPVEYRLQNDTQDHQQHDHAFLIDFEAPAGSGTNRFQVVNQLTVLGTRGPAHARREESRQRHAPVAPPRSGGVY